MSSSGSTRELCKAINTFVQSPKLPLPDELNEVISAYLDKHDKYDEQSADRLNDELLSIYQKRVEGYSDRYAAFLAILRPLRRAIRSPAKIMQWLDRLMDPVLEHLKHERGLANEALANVLELLSFDGDESAASDTFKQNLFADRLLKRWMQLNEIAQTSVNPSSDFKERVLREGIIIFGKKDPTSFLTSLDTLFIKKDCRNRALHMLCEFIQSQPPHLHLVVQTPLFGNILQSLQHDDSTTTVSLCLVALIMLLPHMPSSLVPFLPVLFNIYARLLFWDRDRSFAKEHAEWDAQSPGVGGTNGASWEKCLFDNDLDGNSIPYLSSYFTILYGLYPINFVEYIRKPQRYLRHANNADDIDVQAMEIRDRSEPFRQGHLLHPNFYNLTIESEKTDFTRWMKSEAAEVMVDSMALCIQPSTGPQNGVPPLHGTTSPASNDASDKESQDVALLSGSGAMPALQSQDTESNRLRPISNVTDSAASNKVDHPRRRYSSSSHQSGRDSIETRPPNVGSDSPTLPPHLAPSSSHTHLQDMIHSNKMIKAGLQSLANDSVPSLALSHPESIPERTFLQLQATGNPMTSPIPAEMSSQLARFHRQNLLLQNDLNFERYMKQQHTTHVGTLRRMQVRQAATEAETQNLIMANRSLKQRLDEAKREELRAKKESNSRQTRSKKWEADLSAKLRTLREEKKKWDAAEAQLRRELDTARVECERMRGVVASAAEVALQAKQDSQAVDIGVDEIERLQAEVTRLSASERRYQGMERAMQQATTDGAAAVDRAEQLSSDLAAREKQLQQAREAYETQIVVLNTRLAEASRDSATQRRHSSADAASMFESALAASRARQAELQRQFALLDRKYKMLQSSLIDMQTDAAERRHAVTASTTSSSLDGDAHGEQLPGPLVARTRSRRGFSDPDVAFEHSGGGHNGTSSPEHASQWSSGGGGHAHAPSTPPQPGHAELPASSLSRTASSPQSERYHGRGGVQNVIRKERRESGKKEEKPEKKEKKSGGIRGIRGFV